MHAIVIPSGIKRPFTPIDRSIVKALKQLDVNVTTVLPGKEMSQRCLPVIKEQKPDFILVLMAWKLTKKNVALLKNIKQIPKCVWFTDDPYYMDWSRSVGKHFDIVFTNESRSVAVYRRNGCKHVHHLPLGVDTSDFFPRDAVPERYRSDVLVLGTAFNNRRVFLRKLLPLLSKVNVRLIGPGWEKLNLKQRRNVATRAQWVSMKEANAYYNGARIVLNLHRSARDEYLRLNTRLVPAHTPNNRTFEVAACSAFQLIEARPDLASLYPPRTSVPTFHTPRECCELITYYLPRKKQRNDIADRTYRHTLETHQYIHRMQAVLKHIKQENY